MATHRAPIVAPIPPFKGGPLQATDSPNRRVPVGAYEEIKNATARSTAGNRRPSVGSSGAENARSSATQASSHRSRVRPPTAEGRDPHYPAGGERRSRQGSSHGETAQERPRPTSRLEMEKKRHHNDPKSIGPWRLDKLIGQGASGRVRLAYHSVTGQQAAVKIIPRQLINQSRMSLRDADAKMNKMILGIEREIVIMKLIEHPNLLGLWDVYETSKELYLIMEYVAGGELFDHLVAQGKLKPAAARAYFRQIIFGMDYCHRFNICHRDLKPENLLLDASKKIVKVADFGMAALQPTERMLETSCGSPHYASPEIVSGKRYKGTASDIWSCGIILFALLCGRLPFDDPNIQLLLGKVKAGKFQMPDWLERSSQDLIWRMLEVDPERRITMPEIMRHPWFTNNGEESDRNPVTTSFDSFQNDQLTLGEIDQDILGNLKTLWPELSVQNITEQLISPGPNWQKTFYSLLVTHRENHSADDDDFAEPEKPSTGGSTRDENSFIASMHAQQQQRERAKPRRSFDAAGSPSLAHPPLPGQESSSGKPVAHRTAPPSPAINTVPLPSAPGATRSRPPSRQSNEIAAYQNDGAANSRSAVAARNSVDVARAAGRASMDAPRSPAGARPLPSPTKGASGSRTPQMDTRIPEIKLQGTTPGVEEARTVSLQRRTTSPSQRPAAAHTRSYNDENQSTPVRTRVSRAQASDITPKPTARASSRPVSPTKPGHTGKRPSSVHSAHGAPTITVPQVGDATMQRFFQEIADELASIRATGEKPDGLQTKLDRLRDSVGPSEHLYQQGTPVFEGLASPAMTNFSDMTQFEDAEDDVSEIDSVRSGSESSGQPYTPTSPLPPPISPALKAAPLVVSDKGRQQADHASLSGSNPAARSTRRPPGSVAPGPRPSSLFSNGSGTSSILGRRRSLLGARKEKPDPSQQVQLDGRNSLAYDQTRPGASPVTDPTAVFGQPNRGTTRLQKKNPGLGLDIGVPNTYVSPTVIQGIPSAPPTPTTPSINSSPKQSWFAGLFNWKPATYTLMSVDNLSGTTAECKRLLQAYGVRVLVEDSEHHGTLKCTVNEYREATGVLTSAKPVRFRVEFTILPVGSATNSPHIGLGLGLASPNPGSSGRMSGHPSPVLSTFSRNSGASSGIGSAEYAKRLATGFSTSVTLVQEKGALSTFKLIHSRMRKDWVLDGGNGSPMMA